MELQKLTNGHRQDFQHLEEGYVSFISSDFALRNNNYTLPVSLNRSLHIYFLLPHRCMLKAKQTH